MGIRTNTLVVSVIGSILKFTLKNMYIFRDPAADRDMFPWLPPPTPMPPSSCKPLTSAPV